MSLFCVKKTLCDMSFIIFWNGTKRCYWSCQGLLKALKRSEKKEKVRKNDVGRRRIC